DVVKGAVAAYLADRAGSIKAGDLNDLIAADESPYIISVRSADDYATGYIPGAVHIPFSELFTAENLMMLNAQGEDIVVYCYTGQTASMATAMLGTLGFDVQSLLHGMCSWTTDTAVAVKCFDPATAQNDFAVETTANEATETYDFPTVDNSPMMPTADAIVFAAAAAVSTKYITAGDLSDLIAADEAPFILSVRSADHYAAGHIPGAVNISLDSLADNLDKLPPDETIVVYCYTGQSGGQATALLNMLGYDATNLKYGMCAWSSDETATAGKCYNSAEDASDFTVVTD
ncbi:MAG: rhodanese-like domain-containing protein, partial [Dehalococcoidia bacterium]